MWEVTEMYIFVGSLRSEWYISALVGVLWHMKATV